MYLCFYGQNSSESQPKKASLSVHLSVRSSIHKKLIWMQFDI